MKKKTLALLLTAAVAATTLVAPALTANATEASEDEITLVVFDSHAYGNDELDALSAQFEADHPGVHIENSHTVNDGNTVLQSMVSAGDIPDILCVESGTSASLYYEYAYDWTNDTDVTSLFHEDAIASCTDENGSVLALPWTYEDMCLLYNKDVFEAAGITELPKNLDELEADCQLIQDAGYTPFGTAAKETWVLGQLCTNFMLDPDLGAAGTVEALENGDITFEDLPNWENLFRMLDLMVEYGQDKMLETDWETSENMLANNEVGIIEMGDWAQSVLDGFNPDANLGVMPCPVTADGDYCTFMSNCNWCYIVNKDSENLDLAKEYLEYILTSEEGQKWMTQGVGAATGVITDEEVVGSLANDAMTYINAGETEGWIHTIAPNGFTDNCGPYLQAYMLGEMSADEVTQLFQEFFLQ